MLRGRRALEVAVAALERQNGSHNLTLVQGERIEAALEGEDTRPPAGPMSPDEDPDVAASLTAEDGAWAARMKELLATRTRDSPPAKMPPEELARFWLFVCKKHAVRIAQAERRVGSRYTSQDFFKGVALCQQNAAEAAALVPELIKAHEEWGATVERTGNFVCPEGDRAQDISQRVEDLAFDGGDFNTFAWALAWRTTKSEIASARKADASAALGDGAPQ